MGKKITKQIDDLNQDSTMSLVLYALYKMGDNPKYNTLSKMPFILKGKNMMDFLEFFGGMTIRVPTKQELMNVISALVIFDKVDLRENDYEKIIKEYKNNSNYNEIISVYKDIKEALKDVEFRV